MEAAQVVDERVDRRRFKDQHRHASRGRLAMAVRDVLLEFQHLYAADIDADAAVELLTTQERWQLLSQRLEEADDRSWWRLLYVFDRDDRTLLCLVRLRQRSGLR